jgi:hypothetical protein
MLALFSLCAYRTVDINQGWMDGADSARGLPLSASLLDGVASLAYSVYYCPVTNLEEN